MLSISKVSGGSSSYYTKDNYYSKTRDGDVVRNAHWSGRAAAALGLRGGVKPDVFAKVMAGKLPNGAILGRIIDGERVHTPGWDLTFSAPKSVSIAIEVLKSAPALAAFNKAVESTIATIENRVLETRVFDSTINTQKRQTGQDAIVAVFRHDTSRSLDPQTHAHAVFANAACGLDGKYRSVHSQSLYKSKMEMGVRFRADLAENLKDVGFRIQTGEKGLFEIAGMPQDVIDAFSSRRHDIKAAMAERGLSSAKYAALAALITRDNSTAVSRADLEERWNDTFKVSGYKPNYVKFLIEGGARPKHKTRSAEDIVATAIAHLSEREAAFTSSALRTAAYRFAVGQVGPDRVDKALEQAETLGRIIKGDGRYEGYITTQLAVQRERATLEGFSKGRVSVSPLRSQKQIDAYLEQCNYRSDQSTAIRDVLSGTDRFVGVQGRAGTGKTMMLQGVVELIQQSGCQPLGLAPSHTAVKALEKATPSAQTLQRFLTSNADKTPDLRGVVLIVDEASMISTQQMSQLVSLANGGQAERVIFVGDTQQLESVGAGTPFKAMQDAGMRTALMDDIKRQSNLHHRQAVKELADGDARSAMARLGENIFEVPAWDLAASAAEKFMALDPARRENAAIMSPTHALNRQITAKLRPLLKAEGSLGQNELKLDVLRRVSLTHAEQSSGVHLRPGRTILFRQAHEDQDIGREEAFEILMRKESGEVLIQNSNKRLLWRPKPDQAKAIELYDKETLSLSVGDRVRATRGGGKDPLVNNEMARVDSIRHGILKLQTDDGRVISLQQDDPARRHLTHAWANTIHYMQGHTASHAIAVLPASNTDLTNRKSAYVAISRGAHGVSVLTDDREMLTEKLNAEGAVLPTALEIEQNAPSSEVEKAQVSKSARSQTREANEVAQDGARDISQGELERTQPEREPIRSREFDFSR